MEKMQYKCGSTNGRDFFVVAGYTKNASDRSVAWNVNVGGDAELSSCCAKIEYEEVEVDGSGIGDFKKFTIEIVSLVVPADAVLRGGKGRGKGSKGEELAQLLRPRLRGELAAKSGSPPAKEAEDEQIKVARRLAKHLLC